MLGALLWLAILPMQSGQLLVGVPNYDQIRAEALMARAWQGRNQTLLRLCGDRERVDRLRRVDVLFMQAEQAFQRLFGKAWQTAGVVSEGRLAADYRIGAAGASSGERNLDPRCQSRSSFAVAELRG
jgi:hypothetical protein